MELVNSDNMPIWQDLEKELRHQSKYKQPPAFGDWEEFLKQVLGTLTLKAFVEARKVTHLENVYHVDLGSTPTSNKDFFTLVADQTGIVYLAQFPNESFLSAVVRSLEYFKRTGDNEVDESFLGKLGLAFAKLRGESR